MNNGYYLIFLADRSNVIFFVLQMIRLLQKGNKARTMEPTALNETSSRSHALLSINVRQTFPMHKNDKLKARVKQGKLFMIDLAGSERAAQTKVFFQHY